MTIRQKAVQALIIDVQERLFPVMDEKKKLEKKLVTLVTGLGILNVPMTLTQQYTKGLGETIPSVKEAVNAFNPMEKLSFSCCGEPEIMERLGKDHRNFVIVAGIEAHICVLQTVLELLEKGYTPVVVEDCISSRNPKDKKIALQRMRQVGAIITTTESILFELLGRAGGETFKAISNLIK